MNILLQNMSTFLNITGAMYQEQWLILLSKENKSVIIRILTKLLIVKFIALKKTKISKLLMRTSSAVIEDGGNLKDQMSRRIAPTNIRYKEDMKLYFVRDMHLNLLSSSEY